MTTFRDDLMVQSDPVVVRCYELTDRVGHAVFVSGGSGPPSELMRSIEGDSDQEHPPSGPMQEMVAESTSLGKPPALMGLGSAGKTHWSCSIEADGTMPTVAFDFACITRSPGWLGSSYRLAEGWEAAIASEQTVRLTRPDHPAVALRVLGEGCLQWDPGRGVVSVVAAEVSPDAPPPLRTQRRWRYAVGLADSLIFDSDREP